MPSPSEPTDEVLATAAATGDKVAFTALLERHYERLFAFAWRHTGSRHEAEDLTQDICVALPEKLRRYDGRAQLVTWLYRVAVNAAHDRRRRQAAHRRAALGWGESELARQDENDDRLAASDWLARAMRALPDELRDTVALTLGEGLPQVQVAEILGISPGTIAWRMSEVKRRLREWAEMEEGR